MKNLKNSKLFCALFVLAMFGIAFYVVHAIWVSDIPDWQKIVLLS